MANKIAIDLFFRFKSLHQESISQAQEHKQNGRTEAYIRAKARADQAAECAGDVALWFRLRSKDIFKGEEDA